MNAMATFDEILRQVHLIDDTIHSVFNYEKDTSQFLEFSKHLADTKEWFSYFSWARKKQFILRLFEHVDIRTVSLVLKAIWNCRPKDAVMSAYRSKPWSIYDQIPMDHDRTDLPRSLLKKVMENDRQWFQALEPEKHYLVITELLSIAGGPIMWEVLEHLRAIYEDNEEQQIQNLEETTLVHELPAEKNINSSEPPKRDQPPRRKSSNPQTSESKQPPLPGQAQKELEINLALWLSTVKSIKDSMKLEEWDYIYKDGTKRRLWKTSKPKMETIDTVDFIQLLPSVASKRILSYLPLTQLGECARVNKYWAYLVDEMRTEMAARLKINVDLEKLRENVLRFENRSDGISKLEISAPTINSPNVTVEENEFSGKSSNKISKAYRAKQNAKKSYKSCMRTVRNMTVFNEKLEKRGAADVDIWKL